MLKLALAGLLAFVVQAAAPEPATAGEVRLDWVHKSGRIEFRFVSARRIGDRILFVIRAKNIGRRSFQHFCVSDGRRVVPINDNLGREYRGLTYDIHDNNNSILGPNQQKYIHITVAMPYWDATWANVHLGLYSDGHYYCRHDGLNFHKTNWHLSGLK